MNILAVNPWIVDYAAYDFWLKPYGFLVLLTYLAERGAHIDYIDCLDKKITSGTFGRGKYYSEIIEKPACPVPIPRHFRRYGMTPGEFSDRLRGKKPDFILITSSMTYWYPAIAEITRILKAAFPRVPVIAGGTYASLCYDHAKATLGCDHVFTHDRLADFFSLLKLPYDPNSFYSTLPSYELFYDRLDYAVLRTSWGCPFECSYCAIKKLSPPYFSLEAARIADCVGRYAEQGVEHFVLYDDAFLYRVEHAVEVLEGIRTQAPAISIHTPNALHLRFLDTALARLLKTCGFINPHFGLETLDPALQKTWGDKVNRDDVTRGIECLKQGGFNDGEFSVYLLLGYPGQDLETLKKDARFLHECGCRVSLAEFSPVPGTRLFEQYQTTLSEPLLHNNTLFAFFERERLPELWELKNYVRGLNKKFS